MTPEDPNDEVDQSANTPLPAISNGNVIQLHSKEFVIDTSDRLTFTEKRLYNIEDSLNHITQVEFPRLNGKLDRLLDGQREQNKKLMTVPKLSLGYVYAALTLCYCLIGYLLFK
jgi:hypothetical protein